MVVQEEPFQVTITCRDVSGAVWAGGKPPQLVIEVAAGAARTRCVPAYSGHAGAFFARFEVPSTASVVEVCAMLGGEKLPGSPFSIRACR